MCEACNIIFWEQDHKQNRHCTIIVIVDSTRLRRARTHTHTQAHARALRHTVRKTARAELGIITQAAHVPGGHPWAMQAHSWYAA